MITRVWGEINGIGSIPIIALKDKYYFSPPPTLNGRYICQFWAEDDYGNVGYNSAILYIKDGIVKCIEVLSRDWSVSMLGDPWGQSASQDGYTMTCLPEPTVEMAGEDWYISIVPMVCRRDMMEVL